MGSSSAAEYEKGKNNSVITLSVRARSIGGITNFALIRNQRYIIAGICARILH